MRRHTAHRSGTHRTGLLGRRPGFLLVQLSGVRASGDEGRQPPHHRAAGLERCAQAGLATAGRGARAPLPGDPLTPDDILDFHLLLERDDWLADLEQTAARVDRPVELSDEISVDSSPMSSGGAVLVEVMVCLAMISLTARRLHRELEPTRRSFELLHHDVVEAVRVVSRDTGRAQASSRLLGRTGNPPASR